MWSIFVRAKIRKDIAGRTSLRPMRDLFSMDSDGRAPLA